MKWTNVEHAGRNAVEEDAALDEVVFGWYIVLYNDDHNTLDHGIDCLWSMRP